MSIQLDDLLPDDAGCYEPPANLVELFSDGSPLFDISALFFLSPVPSDTPPQLAFRQGYEAAIAEVFLKTGMEFRVIAGRDNQERIMARASHYRRNAKPIGEHEVYISGHKEE